MNNKKQYRCLLTSCLLLVVSSVAADEEPVLNVYNWADYIGPDTVADFEIEYGIKVNYDIYDSSATVDAKLMAGTTGYDVIVHAEAFAARLIPVGIFLPLDKSKLPNLKYMDPTLLEMQAAYDPGNAYSTPYMWGTTGFAYNVDMIRERMPDAPLDSGDIIFKPEVLAKFADCGVSFLDGAASVIPFVLSYLGYEVNSIDPVKLKHAEDVLRAVRPHIKYFSSTKMMQDLGNKEVCIAMSWSGDFAQAAARADEAGVDINLDYTVPIEGSTSWFDGSFIPVDAPHPHNAHLFLNYLMRPQVVADISNYIFYANANLAATELVNADIVANPAIYPDDDVRQRLRAPKVLAPKTERLRTRIWARVMTGL